MIVNKMNAGLFLICENFTRIKSDVKVVIKNSRLDIKDEYEWGEKTQYPF